MSTPTSEENSLCPEWAAAPLQQRLIACRIMLYQHGLLTDAEKDRVDRRIDKRFPPSNVSKETCEPGTFIEVYDVCK